MLDGDRLEKNFRRRKRMAGVVSATCKGQKAARPKKRRGIRDRLRRISQVFIRSRNSPEKEKVHIVYGKSN